ncbi:MAG: FAD-binding protein [Parvularculaceae bacterium]
MAAPISPAPPRIPARAMAAAWCCAPAPLCRTWNSCSSTRPAFTALAFLSPSGVRGEGGYLVNSEGERFMERYAPSAKDLASRDVVSRAMTIEICEGRGVGPHKDHIYLHLDHLDPNIIHQRLPGISESAKIFRRRRDQAADPRAADCPLQYGRGIPTNYHGEVVTKRGEDADVVVPGLMAIGEAPAFRFTARTASVRTSLIDLSSSGARGGHSLRRSRQGWRREARTAPERRRRRSPRPPRPLPGYAKGGTPTAELRLNMQKVMQNHCAVSAQARCLRKAAR